MYKIIFFSILTLSSTITISSYADIYKYTDKNGVIHFTNISKEGYRKIITEKKTLTSRYYDHIIKNASLKYDIEPSVIKAVITVESNWDPNAVSKKGALGLMQLMPQTAKQMSIKNPFNPEENIDGGTRYLRHLLDRYDDLDLALAAYNAGPGKVDEFGGMPSISETKKFVRSVKKIYQNKTARKITRIYKVTYDDGTILFTNLPSSHEENKIYKLQNF